MWESNLVSQRLCAAKEFLHHRIDYLSSLTDSHQSHDVNLSIATCYHRLGTEQQFIVPALHHVELAVEEAEAGEAKEAKWLMELLERQRSVEERKKRGTEEISKWPPEQMKVPQYTQVSLSNLNLFEDVKCKSYHCV